MSLRIRVFCGIVSFASLMSSRGDEISRSTPAAADDPIVRLLGVAENVDAETSRRIGRFLKERQAIAKFLDGRRIVVSDEAIDRRLEDVERVLVRNGKDLATAVSAAGFSMEELRNALRVPIAWKTYLRSVVTEQTIADQFAAARHRYDGSTIDVAQIVLLARNDSDRVRSMATAQEALKRLNSSEIEFDAVVKRYSQSPSADSGGRLNAVRYYGDLPLAVTEWAFAADVGSVSEPIESSVGVHIVKLLGRKQGERSLEDARTQVIADISDRLWSDAIASENAGR